MRRAVIGAVVFVSVGIFAAQAEAFPPGPEPSHDQYIAEVDPVCQSFAGPLNNASIAYAASFKGMVRSARRVIQARKSGNTKKLRRSSRAFLRAIKTTADSLNGLAGIHAGLLAQLNGITPPSDGRVSEWINQLGAEQSSEASGAMALSHFQIRPFFAAIRQADQAQTAARQAITGFGFHVCGVSVF
jgi:hypothetical protein